MRVHPFIAIGALAIGSWLAGAAQAQNILRCVDAAGKAYFTDTGCGRMPSAPVKPSDTANLEQRRTENDARVERDKRLGDQLEAQRQTQNAQAQSARNAQLGADVAVGNRLAAERDARNAATQSVLPPSTCLGCRSLGN